MGPIKKFRDFEWALGLNRLSLDMIGIWPDEKSDFKNGTTKHLRVPFMVMWLLIFLVVPQNYALVKVFDELPLAIDNLTTNLAAITSSIKLYLLWNSRKILQPVVDSIRADWASSMSTPWEHKIMVNQAGRARLFTMSGYTIMFICFSGFVASPIFGLSIRVINNTTDPYGTRYLPLQARYPFEYYQRPIFDVVYLTQLIAGSFVGISMSVPDNFFGALVFHACARTEILQRKMSDLLGEKEIRRFDPKRFAGKLRSLIQAHVRLIRFVDEVEDSFNLLILAQVVCLSLIMCCLGFGVMRGLIKDTEAPPIMQVLILSGTLLNLMIHMFIYCIASEIVAKHSLGILNALYCSYWYLLPPKYSKDILTIMMRSKYPLRLTVGKFFNLSLNAYLNILKSSAGYISMLLAVSN